jgi:ClpP class serine protease
VKLRHASVGREYEGRGLLAIDPQAFFMLFAPPEQRVNVELEYATVVDIRGPLAHHADGWCDSYEAIRARMAEALERKAETVVMRIDSPGGDVAGMVDTARALRADCAAAGKTLIAHIENRGCSAAYAIATAASRIVASESAIIGSIGVLQQRPDFSAQNAARGFRLGVIMSGARKADGNPDLPLTEAEVAATQELVDASASILFELVAEMRGGTADDIAALDAKVFHGRAAVAVGLADEVQSFDALLAAIAAGPSNGDKAMGIKEARAALEEAAKGDGEDAAAAKRALAAMDEKGDDKAEGDGDDAGDKDKGDDKDKTDDKAEGDGDDAGDKDKDKGDKDGEAKALAEVHKLRAEIAADKAKEERARLIASRPDFAPEMVAALQTASMKTVRDMVRTLPKGPRQAPPPAALSSVSGTRGANEGEGSIAHLPPSEKAQLDAAMGLQATSLGVLDEGNKLILGAQVPKTITPAAPAAAAPISRA